MIEKLTPKQEKDLIVFKEECLRVGTSTEPADKARAEKAFARAYKVIGRTAPKTLWFDSPKAAEEYINLCKGTPKTYNGTSMWGSQEMYWIGFYQFGGKIGVKYSAEDRDRLDIMSEIAHSCSWWYAFENAILACDRPKTCIMENGKLHNFNGKALEFRDGYGLYRFNGVEVPERLATTPKELISAEKVMAITNVQQRTEGMKKVGLEKFLKELKAETVYTSPNDDQGAKEGEYELITVEIEGRRVGPYLKMVNPSTGEIHVEGVGRLDCVDPTMTDWKQAVLVNRFGVPANTRVVQKS